MLSTAHRSRAVARNPDLACDRAKRDIVDCEKIKAVYDDSTGRHGARKVWRQLVREGHRIARCTVERLMKTMGLQGVVRGKKVITTQADMILKSSAGSNLNF